MTEEIKEIEQYLKKCSNCFTCNNFLGEDENGGHCMLRNAYNYITNLQKENENLKTVMFTGRNYNEVLKSEQDYKQRNEKAVEYIENHSRFEPPYYEMREFNNKANLNELYNILEGGDEKMKAENIKVSIKDVPEVIKQIETINKELDQYKNNWKELKKMFEADEHFEDGCYCGEILNKMKELEGDK